MICTRFLYVYVFYIYVCVCLSEVLPTAEDFMAELFSSLSYIPTPTLIHTFFYLPHCLTLLILIALLKLIGPYYYDYYYYFFFFCLYAVFFKSQISKFIDFGNYLTNYKQAVSTIHRCSQDSERFQELAQVSRGKELARLSLPW